MTQVLRMPRTQRELFELLALYEPQTGLLPLLARIDTTGISQRQIYHVTHRRLPDGIDGALNPANHSVASQLASAIDSDEFRSNVVLNLQHEFPELRRDIALRLRGQTTPKLLAELSGTRLKLTDRLGVPPTEFLTTLARLVCSIRLGGDLLVEAADDLERVMARAAPRPQDQLFVTIDDPITLMVAQANLVITGLVADPDATRPTTRDILRRLGIGRWSPDRSPGELRMLAERALSDPQICLPNPICAGLSHTATKTAPAALLSAVTLGIEITTAADHAAWLLERWGVVAQQPPPPPMPYLPMPYLSVADAQELFPDLLEQLTAQDRRVYDVVTWALTETGRASVTGDQLVRLAGHRLLGDLPDVISAERARPIASVDGSRENQPDPFAAMGETGSHNHVTATVAAHAQGGLAGLWLGFGQNDNSDGARRSGWSTAEEGCCWTMGPIATLRLPRPAEPAAYCLQLDASAFTVPERLAQQRLGLRVNGQALAVCHVSERFVIEVNLPWSMLRTQEDVIVELVLPDAARPVDLGAGSDDRLLGLYVRGMALFRAMEPAPPPKPPAIPLDLPELPRKELALQFESIGENCEFGLLQRRWGAEPLGLLRFASSPLDKLLAAMRNRFRDMGGPDKLEVQEGGGREYMVLDRSYGFLYHAWAKVGELTPEQILTREHRRVPFLIRKLTEELQGGEKLFVYHGMTPLTPQQVRALSSALRLYGPSKLLWMELADDTHPPGSAEWVNADVIKGHMDRFAPGENAHDISLECWEHVCRAAWRLWKSA